MKKNISTWRPGPSAGRQIQQPDRDYCLGNSDELALQRWENEGGCPGRDMFATKAERRATRRGHADTAHVTRAPLLTHSVGESPSNTESQTMLGSQVYAFHDAHAS